MRLSHNVTSSKFHQHFMNSFDANILLSQNYNAKLLLEKAEQNTFVPKSSKNVGKINTRGKLHQLGYT